MIPTVIGSICYLLKKIYILKSKHFLSARIYFQIFFRNGRKSQWGRESISNKKKQGLLLSSKRYDIQKFGINFNSLPMFKCFKRMISTWAKVFFV